ncbi:MAG: hypothetical protein PF569_04135 [Candidatus Woesearchaeota archaeon]|jgi:competence protein ComGC|nr:hypothetical protein [Candidatus Woesearchaeota archaeon]
MFEIIKYMIKDKSGAIEMEELGKMLIYAVLLVVLLGIIIFYIVPNFTGQASNVEDTLGILK